MSCARTLPALLILVLGLAAVPAASQSQSVKLERAFPELRFRRPVAMVQAPAGDARWFVVEQAGRVFAFQNDPNVAAAELVLDIREQVDDGPNEAGLLGLAFHPDYDSNRQVFLSYTSAGSPLVSKVSRFSITAQGDIDAGSEHVILTLDQPFGNHNGGQVGFGPDRYLYIGFGDGGAGGDPMGNGQNTDTLLGAMLRIDVDGGSPYAIPPDNPFAAGGGRPEIFAWGLRNPWRWSFDRATGSLWVGDVGQNRHEEIDVVVKGGNYGWNLREGAHPFEEGLKSTPLIDPVVEYDHGDGCSVTGGYVYRGAAIPDLVGTYLYGDFCSGTIWGVDADVVDRGAPQILMPTGLRISSFAEGNDGELYLLDLGRGHIARLAAASE